jgi:hypothetical protein
VTDYGLDDWNLIPDRSRNCFLYHYMQTTLLSNGFLTISSFGKRYVESEKPPPPPSDKV